MSDNRLLRKGSRVRAWPGFVLRVSHRKGFWMG